MAIKLTPGKALAMGSLLAGTVGAIYWMKHSKKTLQNKAKDLVETATAMGLKPETRIAPPRKGSKRSYSSTIKLLAEGWVSPNEAYEIENALKYLKEGQVSVLVDGDGNPYMDWPHALSAAKPVERVRIVLPSVPPPSPYELERPTPVPVQGAERYRIAANPAKVTVAWYEVLAPGEANHPALEAALRRGEILGVVDALDEHLATKVLRRLQKVDIAWMPDGSFRIPIEYRVDPSRRLWFRWQA